MLPILCMRFDLLMEIICSARIVDCLLRPQSLTSTWVGIFFLVLLLVIGKIVIIGENLFAALLLTTTTGLIPYCKLPFFSSFSNLAMKMSPCLQIVWHVFVISFLLFLFIYLKYEREKGKKFTASSTGL